MYNKCLYFLYGEKRTFETARKFWNILNIPNLDIVIHTPNTTSDYWKSTDLSRVTKGDFNIISPTEVFLYDRNEYKTTDNHVLHYSWRFLSNYLENNTFYDYIFVGRLDSSFYIENFEKLISTPHYYLYPLEISDNHFMKDHSFFGSYNTIKQFVDNLPPTEYFKDPHKGMSLYVRSIENKKVWNNFESSHIRPNMVKYFESYFEKYGNLKNVDNKYWNFITDKFNSKYEYRLDIEYKKSYREDWILDYKFGENELTEMYESFLKSINN